MKSNVKKLNEILEEQKRIVLLIEEMINEQEIKEEKFITASELAKVLSVERGTIKHWIDKSIINKYEQKKEGCKCLISYKEIDRIVSGPLSKYRNNWINWNITQ